MPNPYQFSDKEWEDIQNEIDQAIEMPKLVQLENISLRELLKSLPKDGVWLICMGRFRVRWSREDNFQSWWSKIDLWWIGKIE